MKRWWILVAACLVGALIGALMVHLLRGPHEVPAPPEKDPFEKGTAAVFSGDYDGAVVIFEKIEKEHPDSKRMDLVLYWKAFALQGLGRHKEAVAVYDELVRRFPDSPRASEAALRAAMIVEIDLKELDEALMRYTGIAKRYPKVDYKALTNAARVNEKQSDFDKATANYDKAIDHANTRQVPSSNWIMNRANTRRGFLKGNRGHEDKPLVLYTEAEAKAKEGDQLEALARLKELLEKYPDSAVADDALALQARLYREVGREIEARAAEMQLEKLQEAAPRKATGK